MAAAAASNAPREIIDISQEDSDAPEDDSDGDESSSSSAAATTRTAAAGETDRDRDRDRGRGRREVVEIDDSGSESEDPAAPTGRTRDDRRTERPIVVVDLSRDEGGGREGESPSRRRTSRRIREGAKKRTTATAAPWIASASAAASPLRRKAGSAGGGDDDGAIWERLGRILDDPRCRDRPAGPSPRENELLSRVTEFGITPYMYEVPLGNGVSDCVGHDARGRLCVVEAKCIRWKDVRSRRAKVEEQTRAYATFLAQETGSDVAAYSFDDQNGMAALQSFGVFEYDRVKHHRPRGRGGLAKKGKDGPAKKAAKATKKVKWKSRTENKKRKKLKKERKKSLRNSRGA